MKKMVYFLAGLLAILLLGILPKSVAAEDSIKASGLNLDIARRYYPVSSIKQYIDTLAENGGQFLQLHFADDQNYGIESDILHQTKADATEKEGIYTNPTTEKFFLSYEQMQEVVNYAQSKGIEVIPELDSPGHMWGIRDLIYYNKLDDSFFKGDMDSDYANELNLADPNSLTFMEALWEESLQAFPGVSRVHLGGDEFSHDETDLHDFASYVNALTSFLQSSGISQTLLWNDAIQTPNVDEVNKNIIVTYWTYSEWDGGPAEEGKLTLPEFLEHGFSVYNYNGYYLYFVPSDDSMTEEAISYRERDMLANWNLGMWDNNTGKFTDITPKILGSAMSIWGEDSAAFSDAEIYAASIKQLGNMIHMNQGSALAVNELAKLVSQLEEADLQEEAYEKTSWQAFATSLQKAQELLENVPADPSAIEDHQKELATTYAALRPDKSHLEAAIAAISDELGKDYTAKSWQNLQTALANAQKVLQDEEASLEAVAQSMADLQGASDKLQKKADKSKLLASLEAVKQKIGADYTADSWQQLQEKLAAAQAVLDNETATTAEVAQALADLKTAEANLEKVKIDPTSTTTTSEKTDPTTTMQKPSKAMRRLPQTGEKNSILLVLLGSVILLAVAGIWMKRRKA